MKGLLRSRTVAGVVAMLIGWLLSRYGIQADDAAVQAIASDVLTGAGAVLAIYGRIRAAGPLTKGPSA